MSEDGLRSLAKDALEQIKDKQYTADMEYQGTGCNSSYLPVQPVPLFSLI